MVEKGENGWEKLELEFEIPPAIKFIKVFATSAESKNCYFDDLTIERFPKKDYPDFKENAKLHLYFTDKEMAAFQVERKLAYEEGVHFSNDDWNKGILSNGNDVLPIKARLKGDWLDHIMGRKWSFRLKVRDNKTFHRMRTFSLQTPLSRHYLHEYLTHELFKQEGVLTTRYDFMPLYLNGESLGLYAIEEHFSKQLVEYNLRREGPILKFDENPFWRMQALTVGLNQQKVGKLPYYETSRIIAFDMKKTLASDKLRKQFLIAQALLYQHRNQLALVDELFNLDQLARYWALIDLTNGKHGIAWHNQRFYYNPVLCKLEPINYDNFSEHYNDKRKPYLLPTYIKTTKDYTAEKIINLSIFKSKEFFDLYTSYAKKYSSKEFLTQFIDNQQSAIDEFMPLINNEFPHYKMDPEFLLTNGKHIRNALKVLRKKAEGDYFSNMKLKEIPAKSSPNEHEYILSSYINAYYYKQNDNAELLVENYNGLDVELLALSGSDANRIYRFPPNTKIGAFNKEAADSLFQLAYYQEAKQLIFKTEKSEQEYKVDLSRWRKSVGISPYQEILRSAKSKPEQLFTSRNDSLILAGGNYTLSEKILIPKNKIVVIEKGVSLDVTNKAAIISHSPVFLNGTKEMPINILSSDYSGNGFTVLQANKKSTVSHTTFSGLNTLNYKGWELTGAVNFYESDVVISNSTFENNQCEDALNIVRSDFHVTNSSFYNIFADAFDSDFCTGLLEKSSFEKVGNDAIDFSTSQITIKDCNINNIDDKGISGGEESTLIVENCNIENCNIGVASKDLSSVKISNSSIKNCQYGFVALRKKPEYGAAVINSLETKTENCASVHLIEKGSTLIHERQKIEGVQKNVSKLFY